MIVRLGKMIIAMFTYVSDDNNYEAYQAGGPADGTYDTSFEFL